MTRERREVERNEDRMGYPYPIMENYIHVHKGGYHPPMGEDDDIVRVVRYRFPDGKDTEEVDSGWCRWKRQVRD